MIFHYRSSHPAAAITDIKKALPADTASQLRSYMAAVGGIDKMTYGELQDALLSFKTIEGNRLLINQLEPVFIYLARNGRLWPEETNG